MIQYTKKVRSCQKVIRWYDHNIDVSEEQGAIESDFQTYESDFQTYEPDFQTLTNYNNLQTSTQSGGFK